MAHIIKIIAILLKNSYTYCSIKPISSLPIRNSFRNKSIMKPCSPIKTFITALLLLSICSCGTKNKEEMFANGMAELKKGNPNGATVCFKSALESDPKYFEARHQLAKAYLAAGKPELAAREYTRLIKEDASRSKAKLELARAYIAGVKAEEALAEIDAYVKLYGASAETSEINGIALAALGRTEQAEAALLKALKLEPGRASAKLALAGIYHFGRDKGQKDVGKRLISEVIAADPKNIRAYYIQAMQEVAAGNTDTAITIYRKIHEIDGTHVVALYKAGLLYIAKSDIQQADQIADSIVKQFPKKSEGLRLKGIVNFHRKNFAEAIALLQKSASIQPAPEDFYYLGRCHFSINELEQALNQFRRTGDKNNFSGPAKVLATMTLLRLQRFEAAVAELKPFLAANPGNALAHNVMGSALIGLGRHDEGMAEFNRAVELDPRIVDAHLNKGKMHLFSGRIKDAESDFTSALQASPELLNTRLMLASLYTREKTPEKAMALLEKGLSGNKGDAIVYNYMAAIMFSQGRKYEALQYLLKSKKADPAYLTASFNAATYYSAANESDKAFAEYTEILRISPQNAKAMISIAALMELKGNDKEALRYYKDAMQTKDKGAYLAMAYYQLRRGDKKKAVSALDKGIGAVAGNIEAMEMKRLLLTTEAKFDEAVKICDDMEAINPQFGMHKKIETYLAQKDIAKAKVQASRFITLNPASASGYIDLATVYERAGELDKAIEEVRKCIKIVPQHLAAQQKLGDLHAMKKEYASAVNIYREILLKSPGFIPALFSHGRVLEESGDKAAAMSKYKEVLLKSENYVPALNNLAYLNVEGYGNFQEGLRLAFLSSRLNPTSPEVIDTLGYALLRNKRHQEAVQVLEKAYSLLPGNATVMYHLALAYTESGAKQKGVTLLQKALASGNFPEAASARKLLSQASGQKVL
jgi:putative PEP-CTERM system TPR-repeat lipoprotein